MNRIKFKRGFQKEFILSILIQKNISLRKLSEIIKYNYSSFKSFYQERTLMPDELVQSLCNFANIDFNKLQIEEIYPSNWGAIKGGKKGIRSLFKKYKSKLKKWRSKGGKQSYLKSKKSRNLKIPGISKKLAEFIGVHLGDGTLTKNFLRISGDRDFDQPYFRYLTNLIIELFGISPSLTYDKRDSKTMYLTICSREMCSFLNKKYCLPFGDKIKNKAMIPKQILSNNSLTKACIRGLTDTDGFVGKSGNAFKIVYSSSNKNLSNQFANSLVKLKILEKCYPKENIEITNSKSVNNFFKSVGSSNLRHIVRFREFKSYNKLLYKVETKDYYNKYKNTILPFLGP